MAHTTSTHFTLTPESDPDEQNRQKYTATWTRTYPAWPTQPADAHGQYLRVRYYRGVIAEVVQDLQARGHVVTVTQTAEDKP